MKCSAATDNVKTSNVKIDKVILLFQPMFPVSLLSLIVTHSQQKVNLQNGDAFYKPSPLDVAGPDAGITQASPGYINIFF